MPAIIAGKGTVKDKAVYLALGIRADGRKEVLGLWIEQTEGAKFWLKVFNELKNRGLHDILRRIPRRSPVSLIRHNTTDITTVAS
ncbi:transposase [Pandoraea terrae]|uniref:Mutator family transposase n=1 Tax=Pandoraea terrae TaxID=1537710 RepID=A0A5E4U4M7_9BURK|nr:transposase [Pandoraea terrae]